MKLVSLTDGPILDAFYDHILLPAFPADELVTLASLRQQTGGDASEVWAVVDDDGRVLGGLVGEWFPACQAMLLSYLAVAPGGRGKGIGTLLYAGVIDKWRSQYRPCVVLAEVESPVHHAGSEAYGDPVARLRFYVRHGARLLDLPYFQPALGPGRSRVSGMLLLALHVDPELRGTAGADTVAGEPLRQFIVSYFAESEGGMPDDAATSALMSAIGAPGGVRLRPVEEYREVVLPKADLAPVVRVRGTQPGPPSRK
jgi:GNAT superfamily N-acetyltransferase